MNTVLARLVRLFFRRFFETESAEESRLGIGGVFAILALPATLMCFVLFEKYSPLSHYLRHITNFDSEVESLSDKYLFIVFCMAITGLVAILRWDTLFPDRRDFANLAPLPIVLGKVLLARILALAAFVIAFIADVNIGAVLLYPALVLQSSGTLPQLLRYIAAHAIALTAAGLWVFLSVLAVTGALMAILPYGIFRRVKRYVQFAAVVVFLALFVSTEVLLPEIKALRTGGSSWAEWFPPLWFLGLYQELLGMPMNNLGPLSARALHGLVISGALAAISYALAWRWFFLRSAEAIEGPVHSLRTPEWVFTLLDRTVMRSGFYRGGFRFVVKTVARSDRHSAAFATILGIGITLAFLSAVSPSGWRRPIPHGLLTANLTLLYAVLTGLRLSFGIPADLRANWLFRVAADPEADPTSLVKRTLWCFASPFLVLPAVLFALRYGSGAAALHLLFVTLATAVLIEILTMGFRAVPFTCSWLPGRNNLIFATAGWAAGLAVFGQGLGGFESYFLIAPRALLWFLAVIGAVLFGIRRMRETAEKVAWSDTRGDLDLLRLAE